MNDSPKLRKRMRRNLLFSPAVALPFWLGLFLFLISVAVGAPTSLPALVGLGGMALGVGMATFRWLPGRDKLRRQAQQDLDRERQKERRAYVRRLLRRLRQDEDPRTNRYLKSLDELHSSLEQIALPDRDRRSGVLPEVRQQTETLYQSCLDCLERTLDLWQSAEDMTASEVGQQLLDSREELLGEIGKSIDHLSLTLGRLRLSDVREEPDETLAETREQLRIGLEVARRVEERMDQLEEDLQRGGTSREDDTAI